MKRNAIALNTLTTDGRLYTNPITGALESLLPNEPFASCHAVDLLELPNGDILAAWFAGSRAGYADISIVLSRLDKGSDRWTEPVKVSDDETRSEQNPSLFLKDDGEIWLVYTAQLSRTPETKPNFSLQCTAEIRVKKSFDNGHTWSATETLFSRPGSFCRQKIQKLSNGRWIFGNWICFPDETRNGSNITVMQISDDEGKSWREVDVPESAGRVHANILEMGEGHLVALLRSRFADFVYRSVSNDNGDTWSVPERTELPNNNSSISAIRLQSGAIAMVYNPVGFSYSSDKTLWPDQRCPVEVGISEDEGMTWNFRRIVENGEGFTGRWNDINNRRYEYPVMMQCADGTISIAYTWGGRTNIKYVEVTEDWIRGAKVLKGVDGDPQAVRHY